MTTAFSPTTLTPKIPRRKSRRKGKPKPKPIASVGQELKKIRQSAKSSRERILEEGMQKAASIVSPQRKTPLHYATLHHQTEPKSDPQSIRIEPSDDEEFDDVSESKPVAYKSHTEWLRNLGQVDMGDIEPLAPHIPPPIRELPEEPRDPNLPRGGVLRPKHINMGPYSVPMKNLSDNQQDIHERLLNLQQKASTNQTYDDLVLNENLRKLRGVMGPWSQPLAPAKTFRSENFLYTGVDNKENLNGDALALGRPTRHYKITATRPVTTDPLNPRDPQFRVYNPAITRLPGISFFSSF